MRDSVAAGAMPVAAWFQGLAGNEEAAPGHDGHDGLAVDALSAIPWVGATLSAAGANSDGPAAAKLVWGRTPDDTSWNKDQDYADNHTDAQGWDTRYGGSRTDGIASTDYIKQHNGEKDAQGRGYPKMAPASEQKTPGIKLPTTALSSAEIAAIYGKAKGQDGVKDSEIATMIARGLQHLPQLNDAFDAMGIDTIQAQALFLAHAAGETGGGDKMVEAGAMGRPYAPFQGRGPLQVTNKAAYIRSIAYLETRSDQLQKQLAGMTNPDDIARLTKQKADLDECAGAVKGDVRQAANPKYAFLFSAANMVAAGGVESSGKVGATTTFDGRGADEDWESGGNSQIDLDDPTGKTRKQYTFKEYRDLEAKHGKDTSDMDSAIARAKVKQAVYAAAYQVLKAKADAAKAHDAPQE